VEAINPGLKILSCLRNARVGGVEKGLKGRSYKVEQLDMKLEAHHQETKAGFAACTALSAACHTSPDSLRTNPLIGCGLPIS
jgi:hypothetical protein